jgi:hypothetical protein
VLPQLLHVTDQVLGGIGVEPGAQVRDRRRAAPAAALIELNEPRSRTLAIAASFTCSRIHVS